MIGSPQPTGCIVVENDERCGGTLSNRGMGFCQKHASRWRRFGDPLVAKTDHRPIPPGTSYGRLVVIRLSEGAGDKRYQCRCHCGTEIVVLGSSLKTGNTRSCGCLQREITASRSAVANVTHGHARRSGLSPEYSVWRAMLARCTNPNSNHWTSYGGRGIRVCAQWDPRQGGGFANFLSDVGPRPTGHELDRIDNDLDYDPSNVHWLERSAHVAKHAKSRNAT